MYYLHFAVNSLLVMKKRSSVKHGSYHLISLKMTTLCLFPYLIMIFSILLLNYVNLSEKLWVEALDINFSIMSLPFSGYP